MGERRTIVFLPEGAYGPTNNCVGIGNVLRDRGHRVVFIVEESFKGMLEARGFEEALMRLGPPPQTGEVPGQFWKDFIRDTAPEFRKPTIEQLSTFLQPAWQALIDGSKYVNDGLTQILQDLNTDVIVEDNVVAFPALPAGGRPWIRIVSCNPLEMKDPDLPPTFSGYASDDRTGWEEFRAEYDRTHRRMWEDFDGFMREAGAPALPELEFIHESPWLNLYVYPAEADYQRARPLPATWRRLDSCVRETDGSFEWPPGFEPGGAGPLLYLSLGSLGSADVDLMNGLLGFLAESPYRVIVSMGPQAQLIELPDNAWGQELLPQPAILSQVDLVITHGGNNTVTECLHFGKPMVVLPLFWDQYDNAQRMNELGFGIRLDTYRCSRTDLWGAIDRLLSDHMARERLGKISARLQSRPGTVAAADLIEAVSARGGPSRPGCRVGPVR
jgi:MGT family glycosyltransferase